MKILWATFGRSLSDLDKSLHTSLYLYEKVNLGHTLKDSRNSLYTRCQAAMGDKKWPVFPVFSKLLRHLRNS